MQELPAHQLFYQGHCKQQLCSSSQPQLSYCSNMLTELVLAANTLFHTLAENCKRKLRGKQIQPYTRQAVPHLFSAQPTSSVPSYPPQKLLYHVITEENLKVFFSPHSTAIFHLLSHKQASKINIQILIMQQRSKQPNFHSPTHTFGSCFSL